MYKARYNNGWKDLRKERWRLWSVTGMEGLRMCGDGCGGGGLNTWNRGSTGSRWGRHRDSCVCGMEWDGYVGVYKAATAWVEGTGG